MMKALAVILLLMATGFTMARKPVTGIVLIAGAAVAACMERKR